MSRRSHSAPRFGGQIGWHRMQTTSPGYAYFLFRRAFIGSACAALGLILFEGVVSKSGDDGRQLAVIFQWMMAPALFVSLGATYMICGFVVVFWQCPNCKKPLHFCRERSYGNAFGTICDNCGAKIRHGSASPMRYRLRTLLIVLTAAGVLLARIAYLKQERDWHAREVARLVGMIRIAEGEDRQIMNSILQLAEADTDIQKGTDPARTKVGVYNSQGVRWIEDSAFPAWKEAIRQQAIANRFERAMYRPWTIVSTKLGPVQLPPDES
jgi:hypothetical protein